jgi:hypothetical protein
MFMDVAMWAHSTFECEILYVAKFTALTLSSLLISCKVSFPIVDLKMSSSLALALKSNQNYHDTSTQENSLDTHFSSSYKLYFTTISSSVGACTFISDMTPVISWYYV